METTAHIIHMGTSAFIIGYNITWRFCSKNAKTSNTEFWGAVLMRIRSYAFLIYSVVFIYLQISTHFTLCTPCVCKYWFVFLVLPYTRCDQHWKLTLCSGGGCISGRTMYLWIVADQNDPSFFYFKIQNTNKNGLLVRNKFHVSLSNQFTYGAFIFSSFLANFQTEPLTIMLKQVLLCHICAR